MMLRKVLNLPFHEKYFWQAFDFDLYVSGRALSLGKLA
jgi:hypothetical protein